MGPARLERRESGRARGKVLTLGYQEPGRRCLSGRWWKTKERGELGMSHLLMSPGMPWRERGRAMIDGWREKGKRTGRGRRPVEGGASSRARGDAPRSGSARIARLSLLSHQQSWRMRLDLLVRGTTVEGFRASEVQERARVKPSSKVNRG